MNRHLIQFSALLLVAILISSAARAVTIETVRVGNPGNAPDQDWPRDGHIGGFGAVDYVYRIGRFEVTNDQYAEFLNAVARDDTHSLYDIRMDRPDRPGILGGIIRSEMSPDFSYAVKPNMGNKPVNYVSFWDAVRFANWLHNGQPTGVQNNDSIEDGAYTLGL